MDWILMILNLYAYYLISNKRIIGFILGAIGSILGIIIFWNMISIVIMYLAFTILNIRGFLKWNKQLKEETV